jgi:N-acyl-L-homoserine lactone synthetase
MITFGNFKFRKVNADELLKAIYRLRYQIYVEEFGFEKLQGLSKRV